jgi:hypothetical protein
LFVGSVEHGEVEFIALTALSARYLGATDLGLHTLTVASSPFVIQVLFLNAATALSRRMVFAAHRRDDATFRAPRTKSAGGPSRPLLGTCRQHHAG